MARHECGVMLLAAGCCWRSCLRLLSAGAIILAAPAPAAATGRPSDGMMMIQLTFHAHGNSFSVDYVAMRAAGSQETCVTPARRTHIGTHKMQLRRAER